ncbi:MAG: TonB-dependent receptor [Rhodopila sp.]|nr:TonB-dependent receptor [Rhodopila sp.]
MLRFRLLGSSAFALLGFMAAAPAQTAAPAAASDQNLPAGVISLPPMTVTATPGIDSPATPPQSPVILKFSLPQTVESIDRKKIADTINIVDTEDAVKYLPSIFVRKRNEGDNQPTLETRTWGVNSSARSLVYVDDVPISALVSNNNTTGAPRWGMVSPEQIAGIDMLYGPFAAEYPGNSMGGVMLITTRMPDGPEVTVDQTAAVQHFNYYKTDKVFPTSNTAATVGDKQGRLTWFLSANLEDSYSQPISFITNSRAPAGTTGTISALSKVGAVADVVGAGGLLHTTMTNLVGKAAVDLTDWLRATYTVGLWDSHTQSRVQTYLYDASGNPTYGGISGFGSNTYNWQQDHLMNALSLKTDTKGNWDGEVIITRYDFLNDIQRSSAGVLTGETLKTNGYIARLDGTGWTTMDAKGIWRPAGVDGDDEVSFGVHRDQYTLDNPTYNTPNWQNSPDNGNGTYYTYGKGKTETYGLWAQDAWKFAPGFKLTFGGRAEDWRAYDGYNLSGTTAVSQPQEHAANFSPKASLSWQIDPAWVTVFSYGQAYRYPTVSELYQIVSTGSTYAVPNANLTPESVQSFELAITREIDNIKMRLSLFQKDTTNALVQQTNLINNVYTSVWENVARTRNRGVEFVFQEKDVFIPGLELSNSVTYVDSRIMSDPTFQSATGTTATGKHVPYVPDWRDTVQVTYRPNDDLAIAAAVRYSGKMYSTLDNTDTVSHVMGSFDQFLVADVHVHYQLSNYLTANAGIDNVFNEKYFEYHPFPGRTYLANLKLRF